MNGDRVDGEHKKREKRREEIIDAVL